MMIIANLLLALLTVNASEMSKTTMQVLTQNLDDFSNKCPSMSKIQNVSAATVLNKTVESVDKKMLGSVVMERLNLNQSANSDYQLNITLSAKSTTSTVTRTEYSLKIALLQKRAQMCEETFEVAIEK